MKKLFFVALAAVAMTFTACKNDKPATDAQAPEANAEVVEVNYADSLNAALEAKDASKIEQFVTDIKDKIEGADKAKYASQLEVVQKWLQENADNVKSVLGDKFGAIVDPVANFDLKTLVGDAADGVENTAEGAIEGAKETVEGTVEGAKETVEDVKAAGEQVVENAKAAGEKAVENAKDAVKDVKEGAKDAVKGAIDKL